MKYTDDWLTEILDEYEFPDVVTITRELASGITAEFEQARFYRCIINILSNACQAMTSDVNLSSGKKLQLTIDTFIDDSKLIIAISDTGPGIPNEELDKIFEPLYSTKVYGVGLGLPIVRQILEQDSGGITITSEKGQGTCVQLWLPLQTEVEKIVV